MRRPGKLRRALSSARLLTDSWRLHGEAQALVSGASLEDVRSRLSDRQQTPATSSPEKAAWAAGWSGRVGRRLLGRLDTCLVRALVTGALIESDEEVAVCIGVYRRWQTGDLLDAHAWVTVGGQEVATSEPGSNPYETVLTFLLHSAS